MTALLGLGMMAVGITFVTIRYQRDMARGRKGEEMQGPLLLDDVAMATALLGLIVALGGLIFG